MIKTPRVNKGRGILWKNNEMRQGGQGGKVNIYDTPENFESQEENKGE